MDVPAKVSDQKFKVTYSIKKKPEMVADEETKQEEVNEWLPFPSEKTTTV